CNVTKALPCEVDENEPVNIAMAVKNLGLKHVVVTSVSRDDLVDGGSGHFAKVIHAIREKVGDSVIVEVLIPDFGGQLESLKTVIDARPDIINHNVETVPRLYPMVRPMADYQRSLELVGRVKEHSEGIVTKSGIMVGLGETFEEVVDVFKNLREVDCDILTIGQYLSPSKEHLPVYEYVHPDLFEEYKKRALELGFRYVASGPLVRSSYMAEEAYKEIKDS
ncbi:MAG: lipoyl synthase, partial [Clostridia bacterium]